MSLQQLPAWIVAFRAVHAMVVWSDQGFAIRPKKKWPINAVRGLSFSARLSANACPMAHGQAQYRNAVIFHIFIWQQYSVLSDLSTYFFSGMVNFCSTQIYNVGKCTTSFQLWTSTYLFKVWLWSDSTLIYSMHDGFFFYYLPLICHLTGENIALGKSSLQSSTLWNYSADLAVDSNKETCSFTPRSSEQRWWQVHLGDPNANVQSVAITISPGSYQKFTIFIIGKLNSRE